MPGWDNWRVTLTEGFKQAREEGRNETAVAHLEAHQEAALGDADQAAQLFEQLFEVPVSADFGF